MSVPELVNELYTAVEGVGDLAKAENLGRLLGILWARLEVALDVGPNRFSRERNRYLVREFAAHPAMSFERLRGKTFLDLGCGGLNPFSRLVVLKAAGAARCIGLDLDPLQETLAVRAMARTALEVIGEPALFFAPIQIDGESVRSNLRGLDIRACLQGDRQGTLAAVGEFPIEYRCRSAEDTGLEDASVDGITTSSFLEHVSEPDAVLAEMARICRPGAIGMHGIDGTDHRRYVDPDNGMLDFLAVESDEPVLFGCNRIRPLDFVERFERHGFEVMDCVTTRSQPVSAEDRARMVEPFRSMPLERLAAVGARLAVRRR